MDLSSNKRKDIFENNIRELLHYVDEEGCLRLPRNDYEARRLANWWYRQKKRKTISEFEREKLREVSISFDDTPRKENDDKVWDEFFRELMSYKEEFHTFVVSKKDEAHKRLRNWVIRQRRMARQETLLSKRRDTLLRAGFEFLPITCCSKKRKYTEIQRNEWDDKYAKLRTFNAQYIVTVMRLTTMNKTEIWRSGYLYNE